MFEHNNCHYNPRTVSSIEGVIPVAGKYRFTVHWVDGTKTLFAYEGANAEEEAVSAHKHLIFEVNKSNGF